MHQTKWFRPDYNLKDGDIMLFLKQDSTINKIYEKSSDDIIQKVQVKYRNASKSTDRETYQSTCQLLMIHPVNELDIIHSLKNIVR